MLVEIMPEACAGSDALYSLQMLLRSFVEERHEWAADEAAVTAMAIYFEEKVPTLAPAVRSLGQKAIVDAVWSAGSVKAAGAPVRVTDADLPELAEDLCRAAVLIVEDLINDGAFVRAVAKVFGNQRVLKALDKQWLVLRHAGGTGRFPAVVEAERAGFKVLLRIAVLADSDRLVPGQRTPMHDKADDFQAAGLAVHVLALREAENYLPGRVLAECGDRSTASSMLNALRRLTPQQRDHYDMKRGFGGRRRSAQIHSWQQSLFGSLDQRTLNTLRDGFGDGLLPIFERHSSSVTVADIAALGAHVEADLRALLSAIESVI